MALEKSQTAKKIMRKSQQEPAIASLFGTNGARPISKEVVANLGKAKKGPIVKYNSKVKIRA